MVLELVLGAYVEAGVIAGLLAFNAILGFLREDRAAAALAALKQQLAPTALVRRDGAWLRRPAAELVPGDRIRLPLDAAVQSRPAPASSARGQERHAQDHPKMPATKSAKRSDAHPDHGRPA